MDLLSFMRDVTGFGAAGLMGAMWLWERRMSRDQEQRLADAHHRILRDEERLEKFTQVVEHNSAALERFNETQRLIVETLKDLTREVQHGKNR